MRKPVFHHRPHRRLGRLQTMARRLRLPFVPRRAYDAVQSTLAACQMDNLRLVGEAHKMESALAELAARFVGINFPDPIVGVVGVRVEMAPEIFMGALDERDMISMAVVAKVRQEIMTTRLLPFPVRS